VTVFTQRNFVADFLQAKCDFTQFEPPSGGLRGNVRCSSWVHRWKARRGLPVSVIELFSLGVTSEALRANLGSKSEILLLTQNLRWKGW